VSGHQRLQWLALGLLATLLPAIDTGMPLSWGAICLMALTALKLREARSRSELRRSSLLLLVITGVMAALLPGLGPSLIQLLTTLLALSSLLALELGGALQVRTLLGRSLRLLAAALPLVLVLFLLVPRVGPIWTVPMGQTARTGLSDRLDTGSIADLVAVDTPAARISFANEQPPPPEARYWRVLTLHSFDGQRWERLPGEDRFDALARSAAGAANQQGTGAREQFWLAEPTLLPVLPWSGQGQPLDPDLRISPDGVLLNNRPPIERRAYGFTDLSAPATWKRQPPRDAALEFPVGLNPRLQALGREWKDTLAPADRVAAAQRWYLSQPFRYTTKPGLLPGPHPVDAFLFDTRTGFCEHFASGFTALMRAAGVPARIVLGYQGGDWVPQVGGGGYLDVRQSDAHAWSEVWLADQGWVMVDPTAWVSPLRITAGQPVSAGQTPRQFSPLGWTLLQWRGIDLRWTGWVMGFNRQDQLALIERLLGKRHEWIGVVLVASLALCLALVLPLMRWTQRRRDADGLRRELDRCLERLHGLGLDPLPGEDLGHFCRRAGQQRPDLDGVLDELARTYLRQRFGPAQPQEERQASSQRLRRLRQQLSRAPAAAPNPQA
jgi:protein-glutamine gamma-glutamyltransferase